VWIIVSYINIEIAPVQLVNNGAVNTKVGNHCLKHLSYRNGGEVHIGRKTSCG
jgi:hypothetical protein